MGRPTLLATSMYTSERVMGIPIRRSSTYISERRTTMLSGRGLILSASAQGLPAAAGRAAPRVPQAAAERKALCRYLVDAAVIWVVVIVWGKGDKKGGGRGGGIRGGRKWEQRWQAVHRGLGSSKHRQSSPAQPRPAPARTSRSAKASLLVEQGVDALHHSQRVALLRCRQRRLHLRAPGAASSMSWPALVGTCLQCLSFTAAAKPDHSSGAQSHKRVLPPAPSPRQQGTCSARSSSCSMMRSMSC